MPQLPSSRRLKNHALLLKGAAWSYLILAFLYPVFTLSSMKATESSIPATEELSKMLASLVQGGSYDHVWWTFFSLIPMLLVFGGVGFYSATKPYSFRLSGLSLVFSIFAAVGFLLGIGRWSTLNWGLGNAFEIYKDNTEFLAQVYHFVNGVFGYWFGHIIAEISLFSAIGVMSVVMYHSKRFPLWLVAFAGVVFILGIAATFRNVNETAYYTHFILNNFMLVPLYFLALSIALFRFGGKSSEKPFKSSEKFKGKKNISNTKPVNKKKRK